MENVSMTIQLEKLRHDQLKRIAKAKGLTLSNYVRLVLFTELDKETTDKHAA